MGQALPPAECGKKNAHGPQGATRPSRAARGGQAARRMSRLPRLHGGRLLAKRAAPDWGVWLGGLGWFAASLAAGSAVLGQSMTPFALALVLAVPERPLLLAAAGCTLGGLAALPLPLALRQAAVVLVVCALRLLLGRSGLLLAAGAGVAVGGLLSQALAALGQPAAAPLAWLVQAAAGVGLGFIWRAWDRDTFLADTRRRQGVLLAVSASAGCCLSACGLLGLPWLAVGAGLATLLLCRLQQEDRLPLLMTATALACLFGGGAPGGVLWALGAGWCAGHFGGRSRAGTAGAFFALGLGAVFVAADVSEFLHLVAANALAAALYCLPPQTLLGRWEAALAAAGARRTRTPAQALEALASGLEALAGGVQAVGQACAPPVPDPGAPIEAACRQVCGACTEKARCWGAAGYDTTQGALGHFLQHWRSDCSAEFPAYFHCVRPAALRTSLLRAEGLRRLRTQNQLENNLLRQAVSEQYRALAEGLGRLGRSWQPAAAVPQLEARLKALLRSLQLPVRQLGAQRQPDGSLKIQLTLSATRLGTGGLPALAREVSRCCGQAMIGRQLPCEQPQNLCLCFLPRPSLTAAVGLAGRALHGVSGDVSEQLTLDNTRYLLLCDGMGTGRAAALDAKMAALFTARLLRAGLDCDVAAHLANAALLARAPGDGGSTLDVLQLCCASGQASLYKAGACVSFVATKDGVRRLGEETDLGLPLGSAETLRDSRLDFALRPGDWLVMVTDGALARGQAPLRQTLETLDDQPPAEAAAALLKACLAGCPPQDDCTVAAVHILPFTETTGEEADTGGETGRPADAEDAEDTGSENGAADRAPDVNTPARETADV